MSFPAGSKPTTGKPTAVSSWQGLPEGKGLLWLTFSSSIKSSDSGISIHKRTAIAITIFSKTGSTQFREHAKQQERKKTRDHTALLLSSTIKI